MWQQIQDNKRRTFFGMFIILLLFIATGAAFGYIIMPSLDGALMGVVIILVTYVFFFANAQFKTPTSLVPTGLFEVRKSDNQTLYNVVEEMSVASGLGFIPKIYILDTYVPNAFAYGIHRKQISIIVTKGLLEMLNRDELQGVIAHEIAHIKNKDTSLLLNVSILVTAISFITTRRFCSAGTRHSSSSGSKSGGGSAAILIICILIYILGPLLARVFYFFLSRKREFLADACSAQYTRFPQGLASALDKISRSSDDLGNITKDPFVNASAIVPFLSGYEGTDIFSTHPRTQDRIKILKSMGGADFKSYNSAYSQITKKSNIIKLDKTNYDGKIDIRDAAAAIVPLALGAEKQAEKRRETGDFLWKAAGYKIIECDCNTKLKLPPSFKNQAIKCPHCGKEHIV